MAAQRRRSTAASRQGARSTAGSAPPRTADGRCAESRDASSRARVRVRVRVRVKLGLRLGFGFALGLGLGLGLGLRERKCSQRCDRLIIEQAKTLVLGASSSLAFLNQYPLLRIVELSITVMMVSCGEKSRIWSLK